MAPCVCGAGGYASAIAPPPSHAFSRLLTPSHAFSRVLTPSHAFSRLLAPFDAFSRHLTPSHAFSQVRLRHMGSDRVLAVRVDDGHDDVDSPSLTRDGSGRLGDLTRVSSASTASTLRRDRGASRALASSPGGHTPSLSVYLTDELQSPQSVFILIPQYTATGRVFHDRYFRLQHVQTGAWLSFDPTEAALEPLPSAIIPGGADGTSAMSQLASFRFVERRLPVVATLAERDADVFGLEVVQHADFMNMHVTKGLVVQLRMFIANFEKPKNKEPPAKWSVELSGVNNALTALIIFVTKDSESDALLREGLPIRTRQMMLREQSVRPLPPPSATSSHICAQPFRRVAPSPPPSPTRRPPHRPPPRVQPSFPPLCHVSGPRSRDEDPHSSLHPRARPLRARRPRPAPCPPRQTLPQGARSSPHGEAGDALAAPPPARLFTE